MKEAIGNATLFNIIIVFIVILIAFFVGSLAYSKAYKVKNRIIEEIEKAQTWDSTVESEVNTWLANIGYRVNYRQASNQSFCPSAQDELGIGQNSSRVKAKLLNNSSLYQYCVYEVDNCASNASRTKCGKYYRVIAYMYFDIPVISQMIQIPIRGDSMTFTKITS